jgi:hypothetical protein
MNFIYNKKLNKAPRADIPTTASLAPKAIAPLVGFDDPDGLVLVPVPVPLAEVPSADLASEVTVQVNLPWMTLLSFWKPVQSIWDLDCMLKAPRTLLSFGSSGLENISQTS